MIGRVGHLEKLRILLGEFPVVGLIGVRQVGKTPRATALVRSRGDVESLPGHRLVAPA